MENEKNLENSPKKKRFGDALKGKVKSAFTRRIFLSHKFEDKPSARKIAAYLKEAGLDVFLDEQDEDLQAAVEAGSEKDVTRRIKSGIRQCTHLLVILSKKTKGSFWVPFEIGYGHAFLVDWSSPLQRLKNLKVSVLLLADMDEVKLPEYLEIANIVNGIDSLNQYIADLREGPRSGLIKDLRKRGIIPEAGEGKHPLSGILEG